MTFLFLILLNFVLFLYIKIRLEKKFQNSYTVFLTDGEGNRQRLSDTISYLLEQSQVQEKRLLYIVDEMAQQWDSIELIKDQLGLEDQDGPRQT